MLLTASNYFKETKGINFSELPEALQKGHSFVIKSTENGTNWNAYSTSQNIQRVIDAYFSKLDEYLEKNQSKKKTLPKEETKHEVKHEHAPVVHHTPKKERKTKVVPSGSDEPEILLVERIPEEIRFIRRYVSWHNKRKTKEDFLRFINALQRAIIEKRVRKTSPYAKELKHIQDNLIRVYNSMGKSIPVGLHHDVYNRFKEIIASEKVMPSVALIKRYINLNGKYGVKDKAQVLVSAMTKAFEKGKIGKTDKYFKVFDQMHYNLSQYIKDKKQKILSIERTELDGLNGFLSGCGCEMAGPETEELNGINCLSAETEKPENQAEVATVKSLPGVMNSMEFKNMQFKTLGFVGKYRTLIGDPAPGFSAMVYGRPKMGKSFLCVDFAGYLARNHGKVLYIAREEGLDMTLQEKLKAKDVVHPNLYVAEEIPEDISPFDFIFLDSVNKLGLSAKDLETLRSSNPGKSFIFVFQTTKDGHFRGANEFQHDVDIVIEVPEKGRAVQNGRYNQGGEMEIFHSFESIVNGSIKKVPSMAGAKKDRERQNSYICNMFDLKKFISLIGIEDELMQLFFDKAEAEGLEPRFDVYHVRAGDETPSEREIEIMKEIYAKNVVGTHYEAQYKNADVEFPERLAEKNRKRIELLRTKK